MQIYLWWVVIGIFLVILEFLTPTLFFLNLGIACFLVAVFAYLGFSQVIQAIIFLISSAVLLLFVKPIVQKFYDKKSDISDKYIGQTVKVIQKIDKFNGRITIYGEEWQAKAINEEDVFEIGDEVKIVKRESLVLYVEKI